jgi:transcriptional adapter 2-alpha
MDIAFDIDPSEFQERKRRRISSLNTAAPPPLRTAPTSTPGVHEIATFLPGRLEFEHELDNEAEDLVKDLELGLCYQWDGDEILEDENDPDVKARAKLGEERKDEPVRESSPSGNSARGPDLGLKNGEKKMVNGDGYGTFVNGHSGPSNPDDPSAENGSTSDIEAMWTRSHNLSR